MDANIPFTAIKAEAIESAMSVPGDDDDVYLNKLQTRDVKKSILYR
jgi:hypothetical protein